MAVPTGKTIKVKHLPKPKVDGKYVIEMLASLCYYYPQYTLAQARKLPYKHVVLLLKVANKMEARKYYNLTQIAAAPHSKKGAGVKKIASFYERIMNNG